MSQTAAARVAPRPIPRPALRERPQPRLRVVAPAPRRSAGGLALLSVGLLGLGLLVLLLLNISIGKGAFALTELQQQQRQLTENRQTLAEQVEAASAPQKLAAKARKLGMVPAPNTAFVRLPDGTLQGKPEMAMAPAKKVQKIAKKVADQTRRTGAKINAANRSGAGTNATTGGTATAQGDRKTAGVQATGQHVDETTP
jgi:uncharacterized protein HemX